MSFSDAGNGVKGGVSGLNFGPKAATANRRFQISGSPWQGSNLMGTINWGPSSDHSGGLVLHGWGDGHVSAQNEDIDATLYLQLCTRADREPVADPTTTGG